MKKIFVDLGLCAHGIIKRATVVGRSYAGPEVYDMDIFDEGGVDDGIYIPPRHISLSRYELKALYDALKAIYEPTVEG